MSKRSRPKRKETVVSRAKSPAIPAIPSPGKPQHYRLCVGDRHPDTLPENLQDTSALIGLEKPIRELLLDTQVLVERGPLGLCEQRGKEAAFYGVFRLGEDGTHEWYRPTWIVIEPIKEDTA